MFEVYLEADLTFREPKANNYSRSKVNKDYFTKHYYNISQIVHRYYLSIILYTYCKFIA